MAFDYYYGVETQQFSFYRVPRLLIKDKQFRGLSSDAKLLYGLMLDRMSLSMKNGWLDEENRVYIIYTIDNIMEDLGCARATCMKVIKELDSDNGIGLIEKKRKGLGKPDIIYVKNFTTVKNKESCEEFDKADKTTEVQKLNFKKFNNYTSGSSKTELVEVQNLNPNYTNQNNIDVNYINPINQSGKSEQKTEIVDKVVESNKYMTLIQDNLEYEHHMKYGQHEDKELFEEIYETICDVVCVKRKAIRINGEDYPYELVKSRFLKLNGSHVEYVMDCMRDTVTKITNIRTYLITALYNAPTTMNHYYKQEVQYDMHSGYG